jgi:4-hydroxybenzoate polyprenyltransferase
MDVKKYLSLVKFSHTIFAMPFAIIGFFMAIKVHGYTFDWKNLVFMLMCMVFARNAAMGFNRYLDRNIDKLNPRTAKREIPAGIIHENRALAFVIINSLLFIATTWFINTLVFCLSFVALAVVLGYSFTKRFTALCHLVLGLGLALAPIGAYLTVSGKFHILPIIISFIVLLWTSGFDIIYALQDEDFDKTNKLHSIPAMLGIRKSLYLSTTFHAISATLVIFAGIYASFNFVYWIGAAIFLGLLLYQHLIVKPSDLSRVTLDFMTLNGVASLLFGIFTVVSFYI